MSLPTDYQTYIHASRYARWLPTERRRETWTETVQRYFDFFQTRSPESLTDIQRAVERLEVMPSMRALMTAGKALELDNVAGYNCAYTTIDHPHSFDEIVYVLMCGTGVGFSVEQQYVSQLPTIPHRLYPTNTVIVVEDSKIGWATAYRELLALLWSGKRPTWDTSKVRPKGSLLVTFGGRASGPEPLEDLFRFTIRVFEGAQGRKLTSRECHDIVCKIADIVVVGGVRRSALISLGDLRDTDMREAKTGAWWEDNPQRALANNSAVYTTKPGITEFLDEWNSLIKSRSGERGIFNREASQRKATQNGRRVATHDFGTNPCSEIILRPKQFCNLTEVVARADDTLESLARKVEYATILGTLQSTLTNFRYISARWRQNCEEERLLGVSLTGIMDCPVLRGGPDLPTALEYLRQVAIDTNKVWASKLGIPASAAITCVKPSGTVSQLVDSASGIHPRYSPYYIRTVRNDKKDPLYEFMRAQGFPVEDDVMKPDSTAVFSFPIQSPTGGTGRDEMGAMDQLRLWLTYARHWCEHKPSITVYVKEHEWLTVGAFVYEHFDEMSGVSFLPHSDHSYQQAPYTECTQEEYEEALLEMPVDVDWSRLGEYETGDIGNGQRELACAGGVCEI